MNVENSQKVTIINFNKEIVFGELGALISAPALSFIVSYFTNNDQIISFSAVLGALIGGSIFWLIMRIYDAELIGKVPTRSLTGDLVYFTPAALILALLVYQPTLFLFSNHLLENGDRVIFSVIGAQIIAFLLFLLVMNLYRYVIYRFTGKKL